MTLTKRLRELPLARVRGLSGSAQILKSKTVGREGETSFRVFFHDSKGNKISPWHHIPLCRDDIRKSLVFNYVNEIPRGGTAKYEVATTEEFNPIKQDTKAGKLRYYPIKSIVNYGCLPQTWEDPEEVDKATGCKGDNDPVDVCEIGDQIRHVGEVYQVKLLGALALIDDGETDWKLLAIGMDDPLAAKLQDVSDLERHCPGKVKAIHDWFRDYKIPDGKPANQFAFNGKAIEALQAREVVTELHRSWRKLVESRLDGNSSLWTPS